MAKSRFDIANKKTTRAKEQTKRVEVMEEELRENIDKMKIELGESQVKKTALKIIRVSSDYHLKAKTAASANGETLQRFIEGLIDNNT